MKFGRDAREVVTELFSTAGKTRELFRVRSQFEAQACKGLSSVSLPIRCQELETRKSGMLEGDGSPGWIAIGRNPNRMDSVFLVFIDGTIYAE